MLSVLVMQVSLSVFHYQFFEVAVFDLTTRGSYFTILAEVFTNHISRKHIFREMFWVNRTQDYGLKSCKQVQNYLICHNFENILIEDFLHDLIPYRAKVL